MKFATEWSKWVGRLFINNSWTLLGANLSPRPVRYYPFKFRHQSGLNYRDHIFLCLFMSTPFYTTVLVHKFYYNNVFVCLYVSVKKVRTFFKDYRSSFFLSLVLGYRRSDRTLSTIYRFVKTSQPRWPYGVTVHVRTLVGVRLGKELTMNPNLSLRKGTYV